MFTRWYDIERQLTAFDELNRRMNDLFGDLTQDRFVIERPAAAMRAWPPANLYDTGSALQAFMVVPGVDEKSLKVEVHGDALTVSGERKTEAPKGYRVHRNERASRSFSRSFGLPCAVDAERTKAQLKNGRLIVTMEKHADAKPRQITISTQ